MVGVLVHTPNPDAAFARAAAVASEEAGADWFGLSDAFWWRDVWMLLTEAARVTERIRLGPMCTNPYLRHPFHTLAAAATLQHLAGERVFLGLGAGGSEVAAAAGVSRADAPERVADLSTIFRRVVADEPLDEHSGRRLDVPLRSVQLVIAARGDRMLRTAGEFADVVLLLGIPHSDLERAAGLVTAASAGRPVRLVWSPHVAHDEEDRSHLLGLLAYSALNARRETRQRWGFSDEARAELRRQLVAEGADAVAHLVPPPAQADLVLDDPDPEAVAAIARGCGISSVAVQLLDLPSVAERVRWAQAVGGALR